MAGSVSIYLAAPWVAKDKAKEAKAAFEAAGIEVTSRWIEFHGDTKDEKILEEEAVNDLQDILKADGMVVLQLAKSEGKAFEQGFALGASSVTGMNKKFILVSPEGERGNIFQYLTDVYDMVPTIDDAIVEVLKWKSRKQELAEFEQRYMEEMLKGEAGGIMKDPSLEVKH